MKRTLLLAMATLALLCGSDSLAAQQPAPPLPQVAATAMPAKLDINRASAAELLGVPGIGPRMAQAIVDLRTKKGSFATLDDLLQVRGIKEKTLRSITPYLSIPAQPAPATAQGR